MQPTDKLEFDILTIILVYSAKADNQLSITSLFNKTFKAFFELYGAFPRRVNISNTNALPYFWIPEENIDLRVRRDHVPYDVWERHGFLQTTEGNVVHYGYIEKFIERLGERFNIREITFDRWGAVQMVQNLEGIWRFPKM